MAGMPEAVRIVGMAHGVLFVLYVIGLAVVAAEKSWRFKPIIVCFIASLVPFGTFYADVKYFREK
jgi:integral membrane protein